MPIKGRVREPTAGPGHISLELKRAGIIVESFDIRAYENPLVPDIGQGDIRNLEKSRRILVGGNESALWRSRRAGRDSRPLRNSRPLRGGAARARRMDRKGSAQSDPPAFVVPRCSHADLSAALGAARAGDGQPAAQFRLGVWGAQPRVGDAWIRWAGKAPPSLYGQNPIAWTGFDPLLPFKIGAVNEREAPESGLWLKA